MPWSCPPTVSAGRITAVCKTRITMTADTRRILMAHPPRNNCLLRDPSRRKGSEILTRPRPRRCQHIGISIGLPAHLRKTMIHRHPGYEFQGARLEQLPKFLSYWREPRPVIPANGHDLSVKTDDENILMRLSGKRTERVIPTKVGIQ